MHVCLQIFLEQFIYITRWECCTDTCAQIHNCTDVVAASLVVKLLSTKLTLYARLLDSRLGLVLRFVHSMLLFTRQQSFALSTVESLSLALDYEICKAGEGEPFVPHDSATSRHIMIRKPDTVPHVAIVPFPLA